MFKSLVGSKVGMTQVFNKEERKVVPVTAVKIGKLYVTQVKTEDTDGYSSIQIGVPRDRYLDKEPSVEWFKELKKFFKVVKEVSLGSDLGDKKFEIGQAVSIEDFDLKEGASVKVSGTSKGLGFQGVMRRHGYSGGPASHGSTFHRAPGGIGCIRMRGEVFKGKALPGRTGNKRVSVKSVVEKVDQQAGFLFLRGSVPGKKGFLLELFAR